MKVIHFFLALFLFMIWGFNFVVIKLGLQGVPPIFLVFSRFFLTSLPAIFLIKKPNTTWAKLASYGLIMFAMQFGMLFSAMHHGITPALASILLTMQVFFTIAVAAIAFKEKILFSQWIGGFIALVGILLIIRHLGHEVTLAGFLLVIGSAACAAPGNAICKTMGQIDMIGMVVWSSLFAWPLLLGCSLYYEGIEAITKSLFEINWMSFGAVCYITYLSTFLGYYLWNLLLSKYPMSTVAPFSLLSPIFATVFSAVVLKEALPTWKIFTGSLVLLGLCFNLAGPYLEKKWTLVKNSRAENLLD